MSFCLSVRAFISLLPRFAHLKRESYAQLRLINLAYMDKAHVVIGHAIDSTALEVAGVYPNDFAQNAEKEFRDGIAGVVNDGIASEMTGGIDVVVKYGRVRETLLEEMIEPYNPDLVICSARGLSPFRYALLGSVSTFLVRAVKCDVLVIKEVVPQPSGDLGTESK